MEKRPRPQGAQAFRLAIFDVDGTLLDTSEGILASIRYTTDAFSLPRIEESVMRSFIGPPIQKTFAAYYGVDDTLAAEMAATFRTRYKDVDLCRAVPYDGIFDLLDALCARGVIAAAATYKREDYAEAILRRFGFDRYMPIRHGSDFEGRLHKSDIIRRCIAESGVDAKRAVMIGDGESDAAGAAEAQIPLIGVTYGFGFHNADEVRAAGGMPCGGVPEILDYFFE